MPARLLNYSSKYGRCWAGFFSLISTCCAKEITAGVKPHGFCRLQQPWLCWWLVLLVQFFLSHWSYQPSIVALTSWALISSTSRSVGWLAFLLPLTMGNKVQSGLGVCQLPQEHKLHWHRWVERGSGRCWCHNLMSSWDSVPHPNR